MTVRVTTSDARYDLLFLILNSFTGARIQLDSTKIALTNPAVLLPDASTVSK
jgi:hypothetical protein